MDGNRTELVSWPSDVEGEMTRVLQKIRPSLLQAFTDERDNNPEFKTPQVGGELYFANSDFWARGYSVVGMVNAIQSTSIRIKCFENYVTSFCAYTDYFLGG